MRGPRGPAPSKPCIPEGPDGQLLVLVLQAIQGGRCPASAWALPTGSSHFHLVGAVEPSRSGSQSTETLQRTLQNRQVVGPLQRRARTRNSTRAMAGWDLEVTTGPPPSDARIVLLSTKDREARYHGVFGLRPTPAVPWPNIDGLYQSRLALAGSRMNAADMEML